MSLLRGALVCSLTARCSRLRERRLNATAMRYSASPIMTPFHLLTRRSFLATSGVALGSVALDALLARDATAAEK